MKKHLWQIAIVIVCLIVGVVTVQTIYNQTNPKTVPTSCQEPIGNEQLCWTGTNPNPQYCLIYPSGEYQSCSYTKPNGWKD